MKILHVCSSVLVRPNGIVRYINDLIDFEKTLGHDSIFVTDAKPTEYIHTKTIYKNEKSTYDPKISNGIPNLDIDNNLIDIISNLVNFNFDLAIAHCEHSYQALRKITSKGIYIQHESDVINQNQRYSYLSDNYLEQQIHSVNTTDWLVGLTAPSKYLTPKNRIVLPVPFKVNNGNRGNRLLYIGDSSERKGAKDFLEIAKYYNKPIVITHDRNEMFQDCEVHSFGLNEREEMYKVIQQAGCAYIPSKNETFSIAVSECLQFMPVILRSEYEWTKNYKELGAILTSKDNVINPIDICLNNAYVNTELVNFYEKIHERWKTLYNVISWRK